MEGEIIQTVNDGVALINYTAHGSVTSWYDPAMGQSDVNGMTNSGKYTLAIGNCCLTSTYDSAECFGETWLRAADKGAIGYIGGSNSTYWDEDYWWGVGYHPASQIDGTAWPIASTGVGTYDGIFHENGETLVRDQRRLHLLRQPGRDGVRFRPGSNTTGTSTTCSATRACRPTWLRCPTPSAIRKPCSSACPA